LTTSAKLIVWQKAIFISIASVFAVIDMSAPKGMFDYVEWRLSKDRLWPYVGEVEPSNVSVNNFLKNYTVDNFWIDKNGAIHIGTTKIEADKKPSFFSKLLGLLFSATIHPNKQPRRREKVVSGQRFNHY